MKSLGIAIFQSTNYVASLVDAWIEICSFRNIRTVESVASLVDAWIEIVCIKRSNRLFESHPSWMRGLKYFPKQIIKQSRKVASLVDAWIEIGNVPLDDILDLSHPSWMRGLKLCKVFPSIFNNWSHPSWMRGLKFVHISRRVPHPCRIPRGCVD